MEEKDRDMENQEEENERATDIHRETENRARNCKARDFIGRNLAFRIKYRLTFLIKENGKEGQGEQSAF